MKKESLPALHCTSEPSVSSPAASMDLHSYPTVVGTLIALMEIH